MMRWCNDQSLSMDETIFFHDDCALKPTDTPLKLGWLPTKSDEYVTIRVIVCSPLSGNDKKKRKRNGEHVSKTLQPSHVARNFLSAERPPFATAPPRQDGIHSSNLHVKSIDPHASSTLPLWQKAKSVSQAPESSFMPSATPLTNFQPNSEVMVVVVAQGLDGPSGVRFNMQSSTYFHRVMKAWCDLYEISISAARFMLGPLMLGPTDTPGSIGHDPTKGIFIIHAVPRSSVETRIATQPRVMDSTASKPQRTDTCQLKPDFSFMEFLRNDKWQCVLRESARKKWSE